MFIRVGLRPLQTNVFTKKIKIIPEILITVGGEGSSEPINGLLGLQLLDRMFEYSVKKDGEEKNHKMKCNQEADD